MEYPKIIKGVKTSYTGQENPDVEIPIEDIASFETYHETWRNGLQIRVNIKDELVTKYKWEGKYYDSEKHTYNPFFQGKYDFKSFKIRNKDMPKFRKELMVELQKTPVMKITTGINAGTPIAMSHTFCKKEIRLDNKISETEQFRSI
jgi:hypothetical protein